MFCSLASVFRPVSIYHENCLHFYVLAWAWDHRLLVSSKISYVICVVLYPSPLIFQKYHYWGCLNNRIFSNLGLGAACWKHSMCHHKLWPTSVSHSFSSLNSSLGLTGGKHYQKISIFRLVLQNFAHPGCFPNVAIFSPYFHLVGLVLQYVGVFQSEK